MNSSLRIVLSIALLLYYICIFYFLKKKSLTLKYTLLWLFTGLVMVLVVIFPQVLETVLHAMGIVELTNGLFGLVCFALLIILLSITSIVSMLNDKLRKLVQQCAMYEKRIRDLEEKLEQGGLTKGQKQAE